jgi:phosphoenolpyruvate carboxykinase (ATP)
MAALLTTPGSELAALGIRQPGAVHFNLSAPTLVEHALRRGEGLLTSTGALVAYTGSHTGRSPRDRYLVEEPSTQGELDWGKVNQPLPPARLDRLLDHVRDYLQGRELFVGDAVACADPAHALPVRVVTELAWHALFARCLLRPPGEGAAPTREGEAPAEPLPTARQEPRPPVAIPEPPLTIISVPGIKADPARDGTRSGTFIVLDLARRLVVIGGTHYAGEIKKSVFSFLNYMLPQRGVFPMHCSANIGPAGDTALFFGLSGTGKTTLSADPQRRLIGDDEHAWSDTGVFNIEGGCYAKCIHLSPSGEPQIYDAVRFGAVLENVVVDPATRRPDYDDARHTENTRAAYPVAHIANAEPSGRGGHPRTLLFLACDAFGVLPPLGRLTPEQAMYHFLSGYTAKVAGTEAGVTEPQVTFSAAFASPFLPLFPGRYAEMLRQKLTAHGSHVWLVNTGWTGGPPGVGSRFKLAHTRAMVQAILSGALEQVPAVPDPVFGVSVPRSCPGVPPEVLRPRDAWKDPAAYDAKARHLAGLFRNNFKPYAGQVSEPVRAAEPRG